MADWAGMQQRGFIDGGGWDRCHAKQTPAVRQLIFAATVGEPAEVPDLYKPRRKDMLQEAAQKLHGADRHYAYLISPVVPPAEAHLAPLEGDEPRVRNGDAVRVAGEIFQSLLRPAEGRLGIAWNKPPILIFSTVGQSVETRRTLPDMRSCRKRRVVLARGPLERTRETCRGTSGSGRAREERSCCGKRSSGSRRARFRRQVRRGGGAGDDAGFAPTCGAPPESRSWPRDVSDRRQSPVAFRTPHGTTGYRRLFDSVVRAEPVPGAA